jgi:hypothetical protein
MKKKVCFLWAFGLMLLSSATLKAQVFEPSEAHKHNIAVATGLDNNLLAVQISYAYHLKDNRSSVFASFIQGSSQLGSGNFRSELGVKTWLGSYEKFVLQSNLGVVYTKGVNKVGTYDGIGINLSIMPSLQFGNFGVGLSAEYNPYIATHIKHTDYYKQSFYADVKDGWYGSTATNIRLGVVLNLLFSEKSQIEANLKVGYQKNGVYDTFLPNAYAVIGFNKNF